MSRKVGTPKTGGRKAGTPNKITGGLKEFVTDILNDNREQIIKDLGKVKPTERLYFLEKMMQYVVPKQQAVSADVSTNNLSKELRIIHISSSPEGKLQRFPSSEDEIDLERDPRWYKEKE